MEKLIAGVHRFQKHYRSEHWELFNRLAEHGQSPDALFITCCDSRVDPVVITQGKPGDLFIFKNVGNFVPPYTENPPDGTGVAAAVEYAVKHLHVRDIIVCGHSDCGAMKALYKERSHYAETPHILYWLRHGDRTIEVVAKNYPNRSSEERLAITSEENVLVQVENLRTYPVVRKAVQDGKLHIHAWFFEIGKGQVHTYNPDKEQYEPVRHEELVLPG
ncbi:MAG: carbonic anhydrase [Deltaproteobacteria bacterium]|nr:carbonic anhydrase [Deltaproteobacteria bacterium]